MRFTKFFVGNIIVLGFAVICSGCPEILPTLTQTLIPIIVEDIKARQLRNAQETNANHQYTPDRGLDIVVESTSANPLVVKPGGNATFSMVYAVMGAGSNGVSVMETRTLRQNGETRKEMTPATFVRTDGTWESTQEIKFPLKVPAGTYEMVQTVSAANIQVQKSTTFSIAEGDS